MQAIATGFNLIRKTVYHPELSGATANLPIIVLLDTLLPSTTTLIGGCYTNEASKGLGQFLRSFRAVTIGILFGQEAVYH